MLISFYKKSRRTLSLGIISASLLLSFASSSHAELELDIGVANDYVRNGISQARAKGTGSIGLNYHHRSGLYAGAWTTYINRKNDKVNQERDGYAGFYLPVGYSLALDMGVTRYTFQGDQNFLGHSYNEGFLSLLLNDSTSFSLYQSNDYYGSNQALRRLQLSHTVTAGEFGFEVMLAQSRFLHEDAVANFGGRNNYFHFRAGVIRDYENYSYALTLDRTNLPGSFSGGTKFSLEVERKFSWF